MSENAEGQEAPERGAPASGAPADAIRDLLKTRGPGKTICPSEAARRLAGDGKDWRARMPEAHAAARELAKQGAVRLTQGGETVAEPVGAYRIALNPEEE